MATSSNFGNMFSMAGASLFLPFLPLLPKQILMTNLLTDGPEMTIASDRVDEYMIARPRRWDIGIIRKFMMTFGLVSSFFDFLTFAVLLALGANAAQFRTGWFVESVISAALIVFVVRTSQPFFRSRPSNYLILATCGTILINPGPAVQPARRSGRIPGAAPAFYGLFGRHCAILYLTMAELTKYVFYRFLRA